MAPAGVDKLIAVVARLAPHEFVCLPGLGWFGGTAQSAPPRFLVDPQLVQQLNGRPAPARRFADETARLAHALKGEHLHPPGERRLAVMRFAWADQLALELSRQLVADGAASLGGLAAFEVVAGADGRVVRFRAWAEH